MRRTQPRQDAGQPRFLWPVETTLPTTRPAPDTSWRGTLSLNAGGHIGGNLTSPGGWLLDLSGRVLSADHFALVLRVEVRGEPLPEFEDRGLTADLSASASDARWHVALLKQDGAWSGRVDGIGWALLLRGTPLRAGALAVRGVVGARHG